jgi:hypothetical protein
MDIEHDPTAPITPPTASGSTPQTTEPWRAPSDHPEPWARGKTAEEILGIGTQAIAALRQLASQPTPQTVTNPAPQASNQQPLRDDDDIVTAGQLRNIMGAVMPQLQQIQTQTSQLAQYALNQVRASYPKEFARWEPEIMSQILPLPREQWTLDNLRMAVDLVRGRHIEDLATDRARELAANQGLTLRTDGNPYSSAPLDKSLSLESEKLPTDFRERLAKQGISEATVREFCAKTGMSLEQWFKNAEKMGSAVMGGR